MRVLLYSEALNPEHPSEPGFAYDTVRSIVDKVDEAVVATQIRNKDAIDRIGMGNAEVVYFDTEYIARPIWKISSALRLKTANLTALQYPAKYAFERAVFKHFQAELDDARFDIVHRVAPISSAVPSPLASWSKTPFVIGPVNGALPYPPAFRNLLRREGEWLRYIRGANRLLPYARATYANASAILAAFDHTIDALPPGNEERIFNFPEVGADPTQFAYPGPRPNRERLRFLFVGRLVPFKCVDVAISAFAESPLLRNHRLILAGDGPERAALEELVAKQGLQDCVEFLGWTEKAEVAQRMQDADVFVFPSVRDSGAGVIAEAMMTGLLSIVVNYGPGKHLVTPASGIQVPLGNREDHVASFRAAMETLAADKPLRDQMGEAANQRANSYLSWEARAKRIVEIYRWVVGKTTVRPKDLFSPQTNC
ncbi:MAG: glycosyl transferase family 1 [Ahrensia sp.]|nr:glycosyl transferase family 1 [Ahrensia sp.]